MGNLQTVTGNNLEIEAFGLVLSARVATQACRTWTPAQAGYDLQPPAASFKSAGWEKSLRPLWWGPQWMSSSGNRSSQSPSTARRCDGNAATSCNTHPTRQVIPPQGGTCPASAHTVFRRKEAAQQPELCETWYFSLAIITCCHYKEQKLTPGSQAGFLQKIVRKQLRNKTPAHLCD